MKNFMHRWADKARASQAGGIAFTLFSAVALIGVLGAGAITVMKGPVSSMSKVTKRAVAENTLMAGGKLSVATAMAQGDGGDCDGDSVVEPLEWSASGTGTAPAGGGFVPGSISITSLDPWGTTYGYCVWDHGSDIKNGDCATTNRLSGQADAAGTLIAMISAGPDRVFQTTCANSPTYVTRPSGSDDSVLTYTFSEIQAQMGGIWNLKAGDATTTEISKTLEVKDGDGDVNFALDMATGIGDFIGLMVGTIKGKLTAPVTMEAGLKLDNDTNVTSCAAGEEGFLRYHATNGVEVCDGAAYVPAGSGGEGSGGYSYNGLWEGKISVAGHTCALRADGAAYCWATSNTYGQLGNGTTSLSYTPSVVSGGHKFVQISNGFSATCALRADGAAYCWGYNAAGFLGNGTTNDSSVPVAVSGGHKFVQISANNVGVCGLRTDGAAYCWGQNSSGQVGDGTTIQRNVPTAVSGGHKFILIRAGFSHTCGIRTDGAAYCWGSNSNGRIGDGTTTNRTVPTAVTGDHKFAQLGLGEHTCGIRTDGAAYCWGSNSNGQLGDGTTTQSTIPVAVTGDYKFVQISPEGSSSCAIRTDGIAYCWGSNWTGQLGDGTTTQRNIPTAVSGGHPFASLAMGATRTCGIASSGSAYCWGAAAVGNGTGSTAYIPTHVLGFSMLDYQQVPYQFGDDGVACGAGITGTVKYTTANGLEVCDGTSYGPVVVPSGATSQYRYNGLYEGKIAAGFSHTCALRLDGSAYCWGRNNVGQVGDGTTVDKTTPAQVLGGHKFVQITAEHYHTCGLRSDGAVYCWGENTNGKLGDGTTTNRSSPVLVSGSHKFVKIAAGLGQTCGIRADGAAYCWGYNGVGQLGTGNTTNSTTPVAVTGGHKFTDISSEEEHTCALKDNGAAYCWGENDVSQLGDGTTTNRTAPTAVSGGHVFTGVFVGHNYSCGINTASDTYCWGANVDGKLGDGTTTTRSTPTLVTGGHKFILVAPGEDHTCALRTDGLAYCWGYGSSGRLGDGTTVSKSVPTPVLASYSFVSLAAGHDQSCGISSSGSIYCWGKNDMYQGGNGTTTNVTNPTHVSGLSMVDLQGGSFRFGNDTTTCSASNVGTLRYVSPATWEYCNGTAWGAF